MTDEEMKRAEQEALAEIAERDAALEGGDLLSKANEMVAKTKPPEEDKADARERAKAFGAVQFAQNSGEGAMFVPRNGQELLEIARVMSNGGEMIRDFYRGNVAACMNLIMICAPYRFNPIQVSWKTYKASKSGDAPIAFESQLINAMINMSAPVRGKLKFTFQHEGEDMQCSVEGIERETGEVLPYQSPPIKAIHPKNSPLWKSDPQQQLAYYSSRSWCRRHFPELMLGVYARDEMMALDREAGRGVRDITPEDTSGFVGAALAARGSQAVDADEAEGVVTPDPIVVGEIEVNPSDEDGDG